MNFWGRTLAPPSMTERDRVTKSNFLVDGPIDAPVTIALAHGAGAPMDTPFMQSFATGLAGQNCRVARFEFPYMVQRRVDGTKRPPNPARILMETWLAVIEELGASNLVIGGKSMGGRIASMIADAAGVKGLVCLGYPFHPPGKPDKLRIEHLQGLKTRSLFLQGDRDTLGNREEVSGYPISPDIRLHWLEDGDHGFKPRVKSGRTEAQNINEAILVFSEFVASL